jgi:hypothetical protein
MFLHLEWEMYVLVNGLRIKGKGKKNYVSVTESEDVV